MSWPEKVWLESVWVPVLPNQEQTLNRGSGQTCCYWLRNTWTAKNRRWTKPDREEEETIVFRSNNSFGSQFWDDQNCRVAQHDRQTTCLHSWVSSGRRTGRSSDQQKLNLNNTRISLWEILKIESSGTTSGPVLDSLPTFWGHGTSFFWKFRFQLGFPMKELKIIEVSRQGLSFENGCQAHWSMLCNCKTI